MASKLNHPILEQSFAIIDREIGKHNFSQQEYAIARRVIHATADFEYTRLLKFSPKAIESGIAALRRGVPIVTDVTMVKQGIGTLIAKTFNNPLIAAVKIAPVALAGKTLTETGLLRCWQQYPEAIYVIGNAPTALLALCSQLSGGVAALAARDPLEQSSSQLSLSPSQRYCLQSEAGKLLPSLIIGAPVGFVSVVESKQALAKLALPQIRVEGRKGGSPVAAAILNALVVMAWEGVN
ncbi:cobalt-precorrin-8X methylmutase [Pleurocapsales cyanobacterium LEGE 06147]|nr:cobalt-precorrin-8X methylmutase [Pleurocapsales cyanobacterium LEGE 06147]